MYDVIVTGARCAGSPLAMLLARKGYRVLLVDKARFPSDTVSTQVVWHAGLARAQKWSLLDGILGLGAPTIRAVRLNPGGFDFAGTPPPLDGIDFFVAPRRTLLDKLLVDAAVEAGVELREGFHVSELTTENGRVTGVRGPAGAEKAHMVVGADGTNSLVARSVKAPKYNQRPSTSSGWYTYWSGGPAVTEFENYVLPGRAVGTIPTNDGLVLIVGGWTDSYADPKLPPADAYRRMLQDFPRTEEFLRRGKQVEPLAGKRDLPGFFRKPWGNGWALAGDAGYHKHPLSAQGISDAFRDADLLSEAIDHGFSGRRPLEDALADYERRRNNAVMRMYESTSQRAQLEPFPPEAMALFRALRTNQREADRFFGTDAGTVPMEEFFAPENLARIVVSAPAAGAGG